jgi:hypothetical protein
MIQDYNIQNEWEEHHGEKYTYFTFSCALGAAIVEPYEDSWFWQVDKPDGEIDWNDSIYELKELEGWWGNTTSKEEAKTAALNALGVKNI